MVPHHHMHQIHIRVRLGLVTSGIESPTQGFYLLSMEGSPRTCISNKILLAFVRLGWGLHTGLLLSFGGWALSTNPTIQAECLE